MDNDTSFPLSLSILDLLQEDEEYSSTQTQLSDLLQELVTDEENQTFPVPSFFTDTETPTTRSLLLLLHKTLALPRASNFLRSLFNILAMSEKNDKAQETESIQPILESNQPSDVKSNRWRQLQIQNQKLSGLRRTKRFTLEEPGSSESENSTPELTDSSPTVSAPIPVPVDPVRAQIESKMQTAFQTDGPNQDLWESKMRPPVAAQNQLTTASLLQPFLPVTPTGNVPAEQVKTDLEILAEKKKSKKSKKKNVPHAEHQVMLPYNFFRFPLLEQAQILGLSVKPSSVAPTTIPQWFSFSISSSANLENIGKNLQTVELPVDGLLFVLFSRGQQYPLLETVLCQSLFRAFVSHCKENNLIHYENYVSLMQRQFPRFTNIQSVVAPENTIAPSGAEIEFYSLTDVLQSHICSKERYIRYMEEFIFFREDTEKLSSLVQSLQRDLMYSLWNNLQNSLHNIERLLISLLGNSQKSLRERAVVLLNCLYDGTNWQLYHPFLPKIRCVGDAFSIETPVVQSVPEAYLNQLIVAISMPQSKGRMCFYRTLIEFEESLIVEMGNFEQAGYFDWTIGHMDAEGIQFIPLSHPQESPIWETIQKQIQDVQGRFIVHPAIRTEIFHEVFVDIEGAIWDRINGGPIRRYGNFSTITNALDDYCHNDGITVIYVMGALERAEFGRGNPFSPIDRATPNRASGGKDQFLELIKEAKKRGIRILVDATARISIHGAHRKYRHLHCSTVNENGMPQIAIATDGAEQIWKDCQQLNYRKQANWELYIQDILQWAALGVQGIRIESAHTCPLILHPDNAELERMDSDGQFHYELQEIMDGDIVKPSTNEAYTYGYFGTTSYNNGYPNPFFINVTSRIWSQYPEFIFTGEVYWGRHQNAIISGIIPFSTGLSQALTSVFGTGLRKDGTVGRLEARRDVKAIYDWYEEERAMYPQNSVVIYASSNHYTPYPVSLYGRGAWSAVDLLYFLPEIPCTFVGEHGGWAMEYDLSAKSFRRTSTNAFSTQAEIRGHYVHRASMRKRISVLNDGGLILLYAKVNANTWHDRVFAFARFKLEKMAIIAINFNDVESTFYIDFSPLRNLFDKNHKIYKREDFINPSEPPMYFSLDELLNEKQQVTLQPFKSMCWGIFMEIDSPAARRVLFEHSFHRLAYNLEQGVDPAHNLVYSDFCRAFDDSIFAFDSFVETFTQQLPQTSVNRFPVLIRNALASSINSEEQENKLIATLEYLKEKKQLATSPEQKSVVENVYQQILSCNTLGPLVFVTPEIGRFSKVGGIAVMVDELTQALVALGCEVIVISPYYNFDRKGATEYLKKERVKYRENIIAYVGNEAINVGIHELKENGITYYFIHHFEYFPTPYHAGSSVHQLKTIVLMAKASLELCCQLRILPAVVISNDWFTGLVPAYGRKSSAFGTTFEGVTFFHLVHNLEEGYEGKIYLDGSDHLGYIHHLPRDIVVDPTCHQLCLNASRCALLSCTQWGTVSKSYCSDLMVGLNPSPLRGYLARFPRPFAHSNGIRVAQRRQQLEKVATSHEEAKEKLQQKYFGKADPTIPLFSFVGRICLQKGVHLILNAVRELIDTHGGKLQIIVGGMANYKDPYAAQCAWTMQGLRTTYPSVFWADPNEFFTDGPLLNLGSDFALMPSLFEPSGVVQQEYFLGGTPVIAFKTGGLKDTVFEGPTGNGFTFEAHSHGDFVGAINRAVGVFKDVETYEKLRERAEKSVLDMEDVAQAWAREFARLRKCIWVDNKKVVVALEELKRAIPFDSWEKPPQHPIPSLTPPPESSDESGDDVVDSPVQQHNELANLDFD